MRLKSLVPSPPRTILALGIVGTSLACSLLAPSEDDIARPRPTAIESGPPLDGDVAVDAGTDARTTEIVLPPEGQYYVKARSEDGGVGSEQSTIVLGNDGTGTPTQGFSNPFFIRIRRETDCAHVYVCPSQKHAEHFVVCKTDSTARVTKANQQMFWNIAGNSVKTAIDLDCDLGDLLRSNQTVGAKWVLACRGTIDDSQRTAKVISKGEHTYVGLENVRVEEVDHPAHHLRQVRNAAGDDSQSTATFAATDTMDWWLDRETGLPLESSRATTSNSSKPDAVAFEVKSMAYSMSWGFRMLSTTATPLAPLGDAGIPKFDCVL